MADRLALPEGEIEITPEMIEAGIEELVMFDRRFDTFQDGAKDIFLAMISATPKQ